MGISSNSLFHFFEDFEILKSIITDSFKGSYCKEEIFSNDDSTTIFVPKISFCDIPLKMISKFSSYGKFGIGMKKEWAIKNKLNPVLYIENNSHLTEILIKAIKNSNLIFEINNLRLNQIQEEIDNFKLNNSLSKEENKNKLKELKSKINEINLSYSPTDFNIYFLYHIKPYEGKLIRKNYTDLNYRFYNEREWCFIPEFDVLLKNYFITKEGFDKWRNQSESKPLLDGLELKFTFNDIEHLIVNEENDVLHLIDFIRNLDITDFNNSEKEILYSKITSFEKIQNDY